ncbi:MAG: preprotein translocase subunit YajC [Bacteroidetes bacterium]|nr:MAG: preprotein translocase subunit YajC [Bacteroidota bacterium]
MNLLSIFLMSPAGGDGSDPYSGMIMMVALIGVFYFFFIRPQQKKAKETKKFREALKKGDKVVTIGGIHGKIIEMKDTTITIEVEGQGRLKLNKDAINPVAEQTELAKPK